MIAILLPLSLPSSLAQVDLKITSTQNVRCRRAFCADRSYRVVSGRRISRLVPFEKAWDGLRGRRVTQRYYRLLATPFAA